MPTDGKTQSYGFLDQLSTEQLLDLIRADSDSPENEDNNLIFHILEVIDRREKENPTGLIPDVDQAWEDFQKYYKTPDGEGRSLYPMSDSEWKALEQTWGRRRRRLWSRLLPLAAVVAVTFSSMIAAQGFGFDIFGALARWTEETFHFSVGPSANEPSPEMEALRQAVQGAFDAYGVDIPAPAWYPEGTELSRDIEIVEESDNSIITCGFTSENGSFRILVQQYYDDGRVPAYTFEKDALEAKDYPSNGRLFYVMSNLSISRAVYSNEKTVVTIEGNFSLEDMKKIIDSIGE